ncbi:MAG: zinc-dependent metalloprotease [Chitinophagales bacterium]|nr:zinc-dependent metalloprotease [Chitinophagales bacterium]
MFFVFFQTIAQPLENPFVCGTDGSPSGPGGGPENPICTDPASVRYVRIAVHYLLREDTYVETITDNCNSAIPPYSFTYVGPGNFTETNDGVGNPGYNGFQHAENFVGIANEMLADNQDHWRKTPGVNYPATPPDINIQYLLVGVYFHRDDEAFQPTAGLNIHTKYDVGSNTVIDVYCLHYPGFGRDGEAFEFGGFNKFVFLNDYKHYLKPYCREWSKINTARSMNHEIGHTLNLIHTWSGLDNCNDTPEGFLYDHIDGVNCFPRRANCWTYDSSEPGCPKKPCDEWFKISNNIMDYNHWDPAWTECQIGRMNQNLLGNGNPYIHSCNGCAPSQAFFYVRSPQAVCPPQQGGSNVILNGQPSINENRYLIEICEVLANQPNNCIAGYFNSGWQIGALGNISLSTLYTFQANKVYRIKLTVDNTECPGSDVHEQLLYTTDDCTYPPPPCCFEMAATNPFGSNLTVYYNAPETGNLNLALINLTTSVTTTLYNSSAVTAGFYEQTFQVGQLPSGNYALRAIFNGGIYTKNIVKL